MSFCVIAHDLGMAPDNWQEAFGDGFIQAVAGAAGCGTAIRRPDDDSIDWTLYSRLPTRPKIDVQVKTWTGDDGKNTYLSYPLKIKNYHDLIIGNVSDPRILVVVTVPKDRGSWLYCTTDEFRLHRAAYWVSLLGQPATSNTKTVTVQIPRANLFTADKLQELMLQADAGTPLS